MGTVGRGDCRNYYKGHMDKIKGEGGLGKGGGFRCGGVQGLKSIIGRYKIGRGMLRIA